MVLFKLLCCQTMSLKDIELDLSISGDLSKLVLVAYSDVGGGVPFDPDSQELALQSRDVVGNVHWVPIWKCLKRNGEIYLLLNIDNIFGTTNLAAYPSDINEPTPMEVDVESDDGVEDLMNQFASLGHNNNGNSNNGQLFLEVDDDEVPEFVPPPDVNSVEDFLYGSGKYTQPAQVSKVFDNPANVNKVTGGPVEVIEFVANQTQVYQVVGGQAEVYEGVGGPAEEYEIGNLVVDEDYVSQAEVDEGFNSQAEVDKGLGSPAKVNEGFGGHVEVDDALDEDTEIEEDQEDEDNDEDYVPPPPRPKIARKNRKAAKDDKTEGTKKKKNAKSVVSANATPSKPSNMPKNNEAKNSWKKDPKVNHERIAQTLKDVENLLKDYKIQEARDYFNDKVYDVYEYYYIRLIFNMITHMELDMDKSTSTNHVQRHRARNKGAYPACMHDGKELYYNQRKCDLDLLTRYHQENIEVKGLQPHPGMYAELEPLTHMTALRIQMWFKNHAHRQKKKGQKRGSETEA